MEKSERFQQAKDYLFYVKKLPLMGIISFCSLLLSDRVKTELVQNGQVFTLQDITNILSKYDRDTLFYQGAQVAGNVEERVFNEKDPYRYIRKCNVQDFVRRIQAPINKDRSRIKKLENFWLLIRLGNATFSFSNNADDTLEKVELKRTSFIERSRITEEVRL